MQLHEEAHLAQTKDKASQSLRQSDDKIISLNYSGQGRYAPCERESQSNVMKFNPLTIAGCFTCSDAGNLLRDCDKPLNIDRAAAK